MLTVVCELQVEGRETMATAMKKRPTINDVARRAGVSIKTVSRVFNNEPNVRPATRDRVVAAAGALGYRPNLSARRLAANRAFVICMLYDNPKAPDYVADVQYGALDVCRARGFDLLIHPCDGQSPDLVEEILAEVVGERGRDEQAREEQHQRSDHGIPPGRRRRPAT